MKSTVDGQASTIYTGGRVLALDGRGATEEALLIRDGLVAVVGSAEQVRARADANTRTVDLAGATVMPGLIDTHPHLFHFGALVYPLVDISDAVSHEEIVARIRARAVETPAGTWIMTTPVGEAHYFLRRSWRDLAEGRLPDRRVLDRATEAHPVYLQAWGPTTPNVCAFNSTALGQLGLVRGCPDRQSNVWIKKDADGEPTGILEGSVNTYYTNDDFMDSIVLRIPILQPQAAVEGARKAMGEYNALGVTTVYEGHTMGEFEINTYKMLRAGGELRVRVLTALEAEQYAMPWNKPLSDDGFVANLEKAREMTKLDDDLLRHNGVTLSRGGPCGPGFLRMHEPYRGPYGEPTTGVTFVSGEKEEIALAYCAENDLRLNFIGCGYRDHDEFLDRAEAVDRRIPIRDRGWILQHNYLCTEEHARRYAALGFRITTSMSFSWAKGDLFAERVGKHVWQDLIPLRRLLDAGLTVGCGSDWGPKNIFEHVALAETHEFCTSGHRNDTRAHKVGRHEALLMWTRDAARVLGWQGIGTLEPGSKADLIIVDRDPMTCANDELSATEVLRTVLGGETVHDAGSL